MNVYMIACVAQWKDKLAIGRNGGLIYRIKEDLGYFKELTTTYNRGSERNVVLMGRKTWSSLPRSSRPLKGRLNLVLTNDKALNNFPKLFPLAKLTKNVYFITLDQLLKYMKYTRDTTMFIIGGEQIYNLGFNIETLRPKVVFLTCILNYTAISPFFPDTFFPKLNNNYALVLHSSVKEEGDVKYRFLEYSKTAIGDSPEKGYLSLLSKVLRCGDMRSDRTGVGTLSIFGEQLHMDISETVPLFTTKRVAWKHVIHELLWFLRGDTDAKLLEEKGVKIWTANTSREFLDKRGLTHYKPGILGPGYGWQMRFFGAEYSQAFADTSKLDTSKIGGVDQVEYILQLLKNEPFSRRIMMSYWNPTDFHKTALLPCFAEGTRVLTKSGYKRIEDVLQTDQLLTHLGNWKNIVNIQVTDTPKSLVEITWTSGVLKCTKEHPFLVTDDFTKTPYWCNAEDITCKHYLVTPVNKKAVTPNTANTILTTTNVPMIRLVLLSLIEKNTCFCT
ncbi:thymidylate synthase [bacterium]|nr:thymidylate synthase [bacterium]